MFTPTIRYITDGQSVNATITNAPIEDLAARTIWLRDQILGLTGSYKVISVADAPVTDDVADWSAVYWNEVGTHSASNGAYSPGLAEVEWNDGNFQPGNKNFVAGVVGPVSGSAGAKTATLYVYGFLEQLASLNLLQAGQTVEYGTPCFLSASSAGKLVTYDNRPSVEVILGFYTTTGFLINPYIRSLGETHLHYKFDLSDHTAWVNLGGSWLYPASNLQPYPPIPFESSILEVNGSNYKYGTTDDFYLDADGVHYLDVSFPPAATNWDVFLYYLIPKSLTNTGVNSLVPGNDIAVIQNCALGGPDDVGDLKISVVNQIDEISSVKDRSLVPKKLSVNSITGHIEVELGPYVQSITAGEGASVSSSNGDVTISVLSADELRRPITDIALQNAKERVNGLLTYIGFPKTITTEILCKFKLPPSINAASSLIIYCDYIGNTSVAGIGSFNIKYFNIATNAYVLNSGTSIVGNIEFPTGYVQMTRKTVALLSIPATSLSNSGILTLSIERDITDSYTGELGLLSLEYLVQTT